MTEYKDSDSQQADEIGEELQRRPRSATLLNLKWIADRLRRAQEVKRDLALGRYTVDSERLARALLNRD